MSTYTIPGQTLRPGQQRPGSATAVSSLLDAVLDLSWRATPRSAIACAGSPGRARSPAASPGKVALVTGASSGPGRGGLRGAGSSRRTRAHAGSRPRAGRGGTRADRVAPRLRRTARASALRPRGPRGGPGFRPALRRRRAASSTCWSTTRGVLPAERQRTDDGFELAFATNVLGPFVLTGLLLGALRRRRSRPRDQRLVGRHVHRPAGRRRPSAGGSRVRRAVASTRTRSVPRSPSPRSGPSGSQSSGSAAIRCIPAGPTRPA